MIFNLERIYQSDVQTRGILRVFDGDKQIFECKTLELPWRNNERRISCIPEGDYPTYKHDSPRFGETFWIQEVPNRSEILIHAGNYNRDTLGCVLVGRDFVDIDGDGALDVTESKKTLDSLLRISQGEILTRVHNNYRPNVVYKNNSDDQKVE